VGSRSGEDYVLSKKLKQQQNATHSEGIVVAPSRWEEGLAALVQFWVFVLFVYLLAAKAQEAVCSKAERPRFCNAVPNPRIP
jgi:hypothetical protein